MSKRNVADVTVTIANGAAISGDFSMDYYASGLISLPAAWTAASIGFKAYNKVTETYEILRDVAGDEVLIAGIVASGVYALPAELEGAQSLKVWSNDGAGSDTNQGAARTLLIELKS